MEKKTTIVVSRNIVNKLCERKTKIGDTYDKIINDLIYTDEKAKKNGKMEKIYGGKQEGFRSSP